MQDCSVIAKGNCSDLQFNDFVSVKQYLLIREKGKKYLVLKLSNSASDAVTGVKLVVDQLDVRGRIIETNRVEWSNIHGKAGEGFVAKDKIPVRENCVEVKVRLVGATYGDYTYTVKGGELVVTYKKEEKPVVKTHAERPKFEREVLEAHKFKTPVFLVVISLLLVICALVATIFQLKKFKTDETEFLWKDINYTFIDEDKTVGAPIRVIGYSGGSRDIIIPEEIEGYPVREIATEAFHNNDSIRSVTVLAEVELGVLAFANCDNLTSVTLTGVTSIGDRAFSNCYSLQSVTATNLENIGVQAFENCWAIETLVIENETKPLKLGSKAFRNCTGIKTLTLAQKTLFSTPCDYFSDTCVEELVLKNYNSALYESTTNKTIANLFGNKTPNSLRELTIEDIDNIPKDFCNQINSLETVTLNGIKSTTIGEKAFYDCRNLSTLTLGMEQEDAHFKAIADYAFYGTKIAQFDGSQLETVGEYAFADNFQLVNMNVSANETLTSLGNGSFQGCKALRSFSVCSKVETLPDSVFEGCELLSELVFSPSGSLTKIGQRALYGCNKLGAVEIPSNVREIHESAFEGCSALTELKVSAKLETISNRAFAQCKRLKEIEIPATVQTIGIGVLYGCDALQTLKTPFAGGSGPEEKYLAWLFGASSYQEYGFVPENLQSVTITGDGAVGEYAFYGLSQLKSVALTGRIERIGECAFGECRNLRELRLNSQIQSIGNFAFMNCYVLFEVWNDSTLPIERGSTEYGGVAEQALAIYGPNTPRAETVTSNGFTFLQATDGWYVIERTDRSKSWTFPQSFMTADGTNVTSYALPAHVFDGYLDVDSVTITSAVTSLAPYSFANCDALKEVTFESGTVLQTLGAYAFYDNNALESVEFSAESTISEIGDHAFYYCNNLQSFTFPNTVTSIGDYAFAYCNQIEFLQIPVSVERIGYASLEYTDALSELIVPFIGETATDNRYMAYVLGRNIEEGVWTQNLTQIIVLTGDSVPAKAFYRFNALNRVEFRSPLTEIGEYAFSECYDLAEVEYAGAPTRIGEYAFYASKLSSFTFAEGLEEIGVCAFSDTQLESVTLPSSLRILGTSAFQQSAVQEVSMQTNTALTEIPEQAFYNCPNLTKVTFGTGVEKIGMYSFANCPMTELTLSSSVTHIGWNAFAECQSLTLVRLSSQLTNIEGEAFRCCPALIEVYNPSSLPITRGSQDYGFVALNAVIVHTSLSATPLQEAVVDGCVFKYAPTEREACLYAYTGTARTLNCEAVKLGGKVYSNYFIWRNAFSSNDTLKEFATGVVTEIGSCAFENCFALKKVTIDSAVGAGKVADDAFVGCFNVWEVHDNNAHYEIQPFGYTCGMVASYALVVNETIEYKTQGNFEFMKYGGLWYLYEYNGVGEEKIPDVGGRFMIFKHPRIEKNIFCDISYGGYVIVPKTLAGISNGALNLGYLTVYYEGTESEWLSLNGTSYLPYTQVYYLSECVHNTYKGTWLWRYEDEQPTTADTELKETVVEATCQRVGERRYTCEVCKETLVTESLAKASHSFTGANGECKWCGQTPLRQDSLGELVEIENSWAYPFMITADKTVYSDWDNDYGNFKSTFTLTAKARIRITFQFRLSADYAEGAVFLNGQTLLTASNKAIESCSYDLVAGDRLSVMIERFYLSGAECRLYIENISITATVEEE